jgi:hypothetical protein
VHSLWLTRRNSGWVAPHEIDQYAVDAAGAIWIELYMAERRHLGSIVRTALAAGIEERRLRFAERMATRVSDAIVGILQELGIDTEDDGVRALIHQHLIMSAEDGQTTVLQGQTLALEENVPEN